MDLLCFSLLQIFTLVSIAFAFDDAVQPAQQTACAGNWLMNQRTGLVALVGLLLAFAPAVKHCIVDCLGAHLSWAWSSAYALLPSASRPPSCALRRQCSCYRALSSLRAVVLSGTR